MSRKKTLIAKKRKVFFTNIQVKRGGVAHPFSRKGNQYVKCHTDKALVVIAALGGRENIVDVYACITYAYVWR